MLCKEIAELDSICEILLAVSIKTANFVRLGSIYIADVYRYISDIFVRKYRIFSIFSIFMEFLNIF